MSNHQCVASLPYHTLLYLDKQNSLPIPIAVFVVVFEGDFLAFHKVVERLSRFGPLPSVEDLPISFGRGVEESAELVPKLRMQSAVYLGFGGGKMRIIKVVVYLLQDIILFFSDPVFVAMPAHNIKIKPRFLEAF